MEGTDTHRLYLDNFNVIVRVIALQLIPPFTSACHFDRRFSSLFDSPPSISGSSFELIPPYTRDPPLRSECKRVNPPPRFPA
jgi:hypothetical protein